MRKSIILIISTLVLVSSCTTNTLTGAHLGSMFGSTIGAITGGHSGYHKGALIGAVAGAAVGAVIDEQERQATTITNQGYADYRDAEVEYRNYEDDRPYVPASPWESLSIENVSFSDANGNRVLNAGERAYISFEIYNYGHHDIHNVIPIVTCNNSRVNISTPAIIQTIPAGRAARYKVSVMAKRTLRDGTTNFKIYFSNANGRNGVVMKTFNIRTRR